MEDMKYIRWARQSLMSSTNQIKGICEVLRFIYDEVYKLEDGEIKERMTDLLVEAMLMAKKMHARLLYYKTTYNDTTGHVAKNLEILHGQRAIRRMRKNRI